VKYWGVMAAIVPASPGGGQPGEMARTPCKSSSGAGLARHRFRHITRNYTVFNGHFKYPISTPINLRRPEIARLTSSETPVQAIVNPQHIERILGDVPALIVVAAVLAVLMPRQSSTGDLLSAG
jgi:hypothetical protein